MADKQNRPESPERQNPNRQSESPTETQRREGQSKQGGQDRQSGQTTERSGSETRNKPEGDVEGQGERR